MTTAEPLVRYRKRDIELPREAAVEFFNLKDKHDRLAYVLVLRMAGWTLRSLAEAAGVSRERVRQWESWQHRKVGLSKSTARVLELGLPIPAPPAFPLPEPKPKHVQVEPDPETLLRLRELQPYARKVRGRSTKYREEAEEYTALIYKAVNEEGVTFYHLAQLLECNHQALISRLVRYGYKTTNGSSSAYQRVKSSHRPTHVV